MVNLFIEATYKECSWRTFQPTSLMALLGFSWVCPTLTVFFMILNSRTTRRCALTILDTTFPWGESRKMWKVVKSMWIIRLSIVKWCSSSQMRVPMSISVHWGAWSLKFNTLSRVAKAKGENLEMKLIYIAIATSHHGWIKGNMNYK